MWHAGTVSTAGWKWTLLQPAAATSATDVQRSGRAAEKIKLRQDHLDTGHDSCFVTGGIAAAIYFGYGWVEGKLKSSEPYQLAITALKENAQLKEKMGEIQETGFPIGAFSEDANGTGKAAFTMSVKGTLASGQYQVSLDRSDSKWRIENGVVRLANGETIDITDRWILIPISIQI